MKNRSDMEEAPRGAAPEALVSQARFGCAQSPRVARVGHKAAHRGLQMVSDGLGFIPEITCAWCPGRPDGRSPPALVCTTPRLAHLPAHTALPSDYVRPGPVPAPSLSSFPCRQKGAPARELHLQPAEGWGPGFLLGRAPHWAGCVPQEG